MGSIKTGEIKTTSFNLIGAYADKFGTDFAKNKAALTDLKIEIASKRVRNQVAGHITRTMRIRARK